ncbi:hypothetical protein CMMCAS03_03580 [Clavibacter michiganensis subsp. michiganensis]|nr:hypothetical protein CMMCAS04_15090 [Clavibacter michiganensis subsp. michiganensis]OUD89832.1 hypothetical protein CMMCAS05_12885 [Clavibacter michiganensis subsp. michiganensis]OUD94533.1 hypothetical protein CMMCAS03_03580 [Clavibacter michiganensis subsp. michiganensis]
MNAVSQPSDLRNHWFPVGVFVKLAVSGRIPARRTSIADRTIIMAICTYEMRIAMRARIRTPIVPNGDCAVSCIMSAMLLPKQLPPTSATSHLVAAFRTPTAKASPSRTASWITVSPIVETITRVTKDRSSSRTGSARCVHASRMPARITDPTAIARTTNQVEFCRNPTAVVDPSGAVFGMTQATSDDALVMRKTPPSTSPSRPRLSMPVSDERARM